LAAAAFALSACSGARQAAVPDEQMAQYLADKPAAYHNEYRLLLSEGKNNECLNYMKLGLKAFKNGDYKTAQPAFDHSLSFMESFFVNTDAAQKARSLWYEEGMKDFKGEPYERVMAYYYRGLLYMAAGDYDNARACFKSAILQDSFAEEDQYRADFVLVIFLEGVTAKLTGDKEGAERAFAEVLKLRPDFKMPQDFNTIFIVETGTSPRKVADGPGHSELKYFRGRNFTEKRVAIKLDGTPNKALYPIEDIYFQASTRGGRQIDMILKDKVVFRQTNLKIGSALSEAASTAAFLAPLAGSSMGTVQGVAGGLAVIGAVQQLMAINAKPHADTRYWDNLPDAVHVGFGKLSAGSHKVEISAADGNGALVKEVGKTLAFNAAAANKGANSLDVVWAKLR
jgi:tetratricopeptide (TPR) repeat protein